MPTDFDTLTLILLGCGLAACAYFLAAATDNVIGRDGFGTVPNMIILIAGACLALFTIRNMHLPVYGTALQALACVIGAFACLALLSVLKAFASRLHY